MPLETQTSTEIGIMKAIAWLRQMGRPILADSAPLQASATFYLTTAPTSTASLLTPTPISGEPLGGAIHTATHTKQSQTVMAQLLCIWATRSVTIRLPLAVVNRHYASLPRSIKSHVRLGSRRENWRDRKREALHSPCGRSTLVAATRRFAHGRFDYVHPG